ncbi:hypothetical protein NLU13_8087 [Sarocladium strictum]|uniref:Transcription initiation factor IIA large subunit n=1 Tax=Sarocladium strictum TaxID=5046 RepID=A0AA39GC48_SARSR|nr:hypothetical protein NLU13_8087 [Sarocladium strictum]
MSNTAVGNVYQTIIDEVINSSRVDFEENGVEEAVLEELRQGWQNKLSQLGVAHFPWDPKPDPPAPSGSGSGPAPTTNTQPPPVANPAPPVHTQAQYNPQLNLPAGNAVAANPAAPQNGIKQEPHTTPVYPPNHGPSIKQEPGTDQGAFHAQNYDSVAASRAAQQIQARFGSQAQNSINALQQGGPQHQQPQQPETAQKPPPPAHPTPARTQEEYRQQMAANTAAQQHHLNNGQTDGAGDADDEVLEDFEGVLMRRNEAGELKEIGRVEIDRLLHRHIAARAKAMEGGGLMVPLEEATRYRAITSSNNGEPSAASRPRKIGAHDGGDDEDDEDAINSDLDDPEDDEGDPEADDEGLGHIMLCMYDKVQRVKNKWKCILKDGVLTVNGKEYVFHKATGEYEW